MKIVRQTPLNGIQWVFVLFCCVFFFSFLLFFIELDLTWFSIESWITIAFCYWWIWSNGSRQTPKTFVYRCWLSWILCLIWFCSIVLYEFIELETNGFWCEIETSMLLLLYFVVGFFSFRFFFFCFAQNRQKLFFCISHSFMFLSR